MIRVVISEAPQAIESAMLFCPACGYDLRGIDSDRCPECGMAVERGTRRVSRIPWVHRQQLGSWLAYRRTVSMVMLHPARFAAEVAAPVSFDDARRFARRTALVAWTSLAAGTLWLWLATMRLPVVPAPTDPAGTRWRWSSTIFIPRGDQGTPLFVLAIPRLEVGKMLSLGFALEVIVVLTAIVSLLLWMTFLCRCASYFFHPSGIATARQNRATALSYYACAPLAFTPMVLPFSWYAYWSAGIAQIWGPVWPAGNQVAVLAGYLLPGMLLLWYLVCALVLLRKTTGCGVGRMVAMALGLPGMWIVLTAVAASLPAAALLLALIVLSVQP